MAPKRFTKFAKLPIELRLIIWVGAMEPRIIRARFENDITAECINNIYHLSGGHVPRILHINTESRAEAKHHYTLIKSRLQWNGQSPRAYRPDFIWINYDIDTLYFVNWSCELGFLRWNLRLANQVNISGAIRKIKHIAFSDRVIRYLAGVQGKGLGVLYHFLIQHPTITDITIVQDKSRFNKDAEPGRFEFSVPKGLRCDWQIGWAYRSLEARNRLFFDGVVEVRGEGNALAQWRKFRLEHPEWVEPSFPTVSISKSRSKTRF